MNHLISLKTEATLSNSELSFAPSTSKLKSTSTSTSAHSELTPPSSKSALMKNPDRIDATSKFTKEFVPNFASASVALRIKEDPNEHTAASRRPR